MKPDELLALWRKKGRNGGTYLGGVLNAEALKGLTGEVNVVLFRNDEAGSKRPVYSLKIAEKRTPRGPVDEYDQQNPDPYGSPEHETREYDDDPPF